MNYFLGKLDTYNALILLDNKRRFYQHFLECLVESNEKWDKNVYKYIKSHMYI